MNRIGQAARPLDIFLLVITCMCLGICANNVVALRHIARSYQDRCIFLVAVVLFFFPFHFLNKINEFQYHCSDVCAEFEARGEDAHRDTVYHSMMAAYPRVTCWLDRVLGQTPRARSEPEYFSCRLAKRLSLLVACHTTGNPLLQTIFFLSSCMLKKNSCKAKLVE